MVLATTGVNRVGVDRGSRDRVNVGHPERVVSTLAGGALALYGIQRRDWRGLSLVLVGAALVQRGMSGHSDVYEVLGVNTADGDAHPPQRARGELVSDAATVDARRSVKIERSVTINRPRMELYAIWRDFDRLPEFIPDLESVATLGNGRSHWVANAPGGKRIEWDAEIVNDIPGELIAWKTVGDPDVAHAGSVHFTGAPGGRGTELRIVLDYEPSVGRLATIIPAPARFLGRVPDAKIRDGLRQFKMRVETGDISTTEGQTSGR
jgi:uncharacterized membrane protein